MAHKNFKLPTKEDGLAGLEQLIAVVGAENFLRFIRYARDTTDTTISGCMETLAAEAILDYVRRNPDKTQDQARLQVGRAWGYDGANISNFYRIAARGLSKLNTGEPT